MSYQCPKCPLKLSSNQKLKGHLNKKNPCDFKCRQCNYKAVNGNDYRSHITANICKNAKEENPLEQRAVSTLVVMGPHEMIPVQKITYCPIPIQDYDLAMYKTLKDLKLDGNLEDYDIEYYVIQTEKGKEEIDTTVDHKRNGDTQVDKVTKINIEIERRERIILRKRVKDARSALTNNMLFGVLCCLVPSDLEIEYLNRMVADMMFQVLHHDDARLHNVCLSDMSRGTVRVYSRISEEKCYWATHPKDIAPKIINEHARNLFSFLLEAGTQSLVPAVWKNGNVNCLALNGEQGWSVIFYEENTVPTRLMANKVPTTNLIYTMAEVEIIDDRLTELVKNRKDEVIRLSQKLILSNDDIQKCLLECRRFCFVTMQKTLVK